IAPGLVAACGEAATDRCPLVEHVEQRRTPHGLLGEPDVKVGTSRSSDDGEAFLEACGSSRQCTRDRHQASAYGVATGPQADPHLEHTGMRFLARIADGIDEAGRREAAAGRGPRNEPGHGVDASDLDRSIRRLVDEGATTRSLSLSGFGRPGRRYRQRVTHEPGRADRRRNGRTATNYRAT